MTDDLLQKLTKRETEKAVKAAVTFVVDVTGSMGEEIKAVKAALLDFAEIFEKRKVRLHLGMISFRDLTQGEDITVHNFDGEEFTRSAESFKAQVGTLRADGGGPMPESSYDALVKATEMDWPQGCEKVILLITDAPSHTSTTTKDAAYAAMEAAEVGQFYGLTYTTKPNVRDCYLDFVKVGKGGNMYDLGNKDHSTLVKTIRNIGLTSSERTISKTKGGDTTD
ncbi:VWA domain-containing protein [Euryarchaeota archaeon]|nr:VWA domain-containing protein [Euryarchaeota archaeon]